MAPCLRHQTSSVGVVNTQDGFHSSIIQTASWRGYKKVVRLLLNMGAINPRAKNVKSFGDAGS